MELKNVPFRIESTLCVAINSVLRIRPSSAPYISGDTVRAICQHKFEKPNQGLFNASAVKKGDVVFCEGDLLHEFFRGEGSKIENPFVMVSANDDTNVGSEHLQYIDERVQVWFAQNAVERHKKVVPLPIGLENRARHCYGITRDFDKLRKTDIQGEMKIAYNFAAVNNPVERNAALAALAQNPVSVRLPHENARAYRKRLRGFCFVASPPGHGEDCHRTWEAMYLCLVPIVKRSVMTDYFIEIGLPIYAVENWSELAKLDEADLARLHAQLLPKFSNPALWAPFWIQKILEGSVH